MTGDKSTTFTLTEEEAVAAAVLVLNKQLWAKRSFRLLVWAILGLLLILGLLDPRALMQPFLLALIGAAIVLFLTIRMVVPFHAKRHFRQAAALRDEIAVTWDDEGVSLSGAHGNSRLAWGEFHRWAENDRLVLLFQSQMLYNIVPKRVLTAEQVDDLRSKLQDAHVKSR